MHLVQNTTVRNSHFFWGGILLLAYMLHPRFSHAQPLDKQQPVRQQINLNNEWETVLIDKGKPLKNAPLEQRNWKTVDVPHNWDDYGGFRRLVHGNLHASALYKKRLHLDNLEPNKQYFLWFEGVGSYATVWLNGDSVGYHAGGRTTFTLDMTKTLKKGENELLVRADHPAEIRDLPWVCGGCSKEWGFSEGSQPLGIFRPVHLIVTEKIRIEPFGVHIWNDKNINEKQAGLNLVTEVRNYGSETRKLKLVNRLLDAAGKVVKEVTLKTEVKPGKTDTLRQQINAIENPVLWSVENPYLYTVETSVYQGKKLLDKLSTPYGIRWIEWDINREGASNCFYLNGKQVFINGTAEYEHLMGRSHAFTDKQIKARVQQIVGAGYNSFRDAHQPHNLRYHEYWEQLGVLWWTQMAAHIWFDTPEFKQNFKQLMSDWVRERRNSPSVILWGLENESTLPKEFAEECSDLIRKLDPTVGSQRLITTCNGGEGTDWNVTQNWSGTYGGKPFEYHKELSKQLLNGEYGAWRSIDFHTEGDFEQDGPWSEDRFNLLMESKIRLGEKVADRVCGQYHWLLNSHENPGRTQGGEGRRELDRVGPVNYKGLITAWGEPTDGYYMFRANYAPKETEPMVYIVSHTWPDRWVKPGVKSGIRIFSNCDEVELFNGVRQNSLGKQKNPGRGQHFIFNNVDIQNNVLLALAYVNGKEVAEDVIVLNHLPEAENIEQLAGQQLLNATLNNKNYLYRVNCGGADYTDQFGNLWLADVRWDGGNTWGSRNWTDDYPGLPAFYGSQRQTHDPIRGSIEWPLLQTFRYGQHKLAYHFPLEDGDYHLELFFIEPWFGTGGGVVCEDWRVFDVAANGKVIIKNLDIWKEVGHDRLLKKIVPLTVTGGKLEISFPSVKSGQALVSAIAISSGSDKPQAAPASKTLIQLSDKTSGWTVEKWLNTGDAVDCSGSGLFSGLSPVLYGAEWLKPENAGKVKSPAFSLAAEADVYLALNDTNLVPERFRKSPETGVKVALEEEIEYQLYQRRIEASEPVLLRTDREDIAYALVAAVPVGTLNDARDLRPSVTYQAADAEGVGNTIFEEYLERPAQKLKVAGDEVIFTFQVGLASKYGLEFRFSNPSEEDIPVEMSIESKDGRLMGTMDLEFVPAINRWRSLRTDTGTIINAGTYKLKLKLKKNRPLWFRFVKVQ